MKKDSIWYRRMLAKYKDDKTISNIMRGNANMSRRNYQGPYHFLELTYEDEKKMDILRRKAFKKRMDNRRAIMAKLDSLKEVPLEELYDAED